MGAARRPQPHTVQENGTIMCWRIVQSLEQGRMTSVCVEIHLSSSFSSILPFLLLLFLTLLHQRTAERSHWLLTDSRPPPGDVFFSPCSSSVLNPVMTQSKPNRRGQ